MVTPACIPKIREEEEQVQLQLGHLAEGLDPLAEGSKIDCDQDLRGSGQGNSMQDPALMRFDHKRANQTDKNARFALLARDLTICKVGASGGIKEMQERLRRALELDSVSRFPSLSKAFCAALDNQRHPSHLALRELRQAKDFHHVAANRS
jgi:hypothetical protein